MGQRIYRYEVPVDDQWHAIDMQGGQPLLVGCRKLRTVEFWACHDDAEPTYRCSFRVIGTGQQMPENPFYHGTAVAPGGDLEVTQELLGTIFMLGDGRHRTWGNAKIAEHQLRVNMLVRNSIGAVTTAARHMVAINMIKQAGVSCLEEIGKKWPLSSTSEAARLRASEDAHAARSRRPAPRAPA